MPKVNRKIRQEVSQITDILIPEHRWEEYINLMDRENKFTRKNLISIIMVMCQELEQFEAMLEDLYFQVDLLQGLKPAEPLPTEVKIRTTATIYEDLAKLVKPGIKALYVSEKDWEVLGANIDPVLSKTKPEYGYGKEIDPKTGDERTCLYFQNLPVFRSTKI